MRILLVNDDGIASEGISQLAGNLASAHELWIVAPDSQKSGTSHSLTLNGAVRSRRLGERKHIVRGTPADCVLIGLQHIVKGSPDLVISGINIGANLGADLIYSGTAAAARQAVILGIPGVAVSLNTFEPPLHLSTAVSFVTANVMKFVELWTGSEDRTYFLNVNIPNTDPFSGKVVVAPPAKLTYENSISSFEAPDGETYHFYNDTGKIGIDENRVTDVDQLNRGNIVVTPVSVYPEQSKTDVDYGSEVFSLG